MLADELFLTLGAVRGCPGRRQDGDIVLKLDPSLAGEAYTLLVEKSAVVSGGNYAAVAMGSVTLSQAIQQRRQGLRAQAQSRGCADYRMRAIQMCIKHQPHQMSKIKQGVDICRQYKLNTLALHCSNYQILWLLVPRLPREAAGQGRLGRRANLFARRVERSHRVRPPARRGDPARVGPGRFCQLHEGLVLQGPQVRPRQNFDPTRQTLLDSPNFWAAIDEMSGQLARYSTPPSTSMSGALSARPGRWRPSRTGRSCKRRVRHSADVWAWVLKRLYEINKRHGKQTMAFEGVDADSAAHVKLPKEVAFFAYQTWYYPADAMIADGYRVLNAAWRPPYTCGGYPAREIYNWNPRILWHNIDSGINVQLPKSEVLLGSLLSTWEGGEIGHLEFLTDRGLRWPSAAGTAAPARPGRTSPPPEADGGPAGGDPVSHGHYPWRAA